MRTRWMTLICGILSCTLIVGCKEDVAAKPARSAARKSASAPPAAPAPLTFDRVKADLKASAGKTAAWKAKLVEYIVYSGEKSGEATGYYTLFAEDPTKPDVFTPNRTFLIALDKLEATPEAKTVKLNKQKYVFIPGGSWEVNGCTELVLSVSGTVSGEEVPFHSHREGMPKTAPLLKDVSVDVWRPGSATGR